MDEFTEKELQEALRIVSSTINQCEKTQLKFAVGTSQHTLLKNRIKALYISKFLIEDGSVMDKYTKEELIEALRPISSIISKCEKALIKHVEGTSHHTRLNKIIKAMVVSKEFIINEISSRG